MINTGTMSQLTLEVPDEILTLTATPEGMARAQAAVLAAFGIADDYGVADELSAEERIKVSKHSNRLGGLPQMFFLFSLW